MNQAARVSAKTDTKTRNNLPDRITAELITMGWVLGEEGTSAPEPDVLVVGVPVLLLTVVPLLLVLFPLVVLLATVELLVLLMVELLVLLAGAKELRSMKDCPKSVAFYKTAVPLSNCPCAQIILITPKVRFVNMISLLALTEELNGIINCTEKFPDSELS